jgi:type I restriction enzyme S subunit
VTWETVPLGDVADFVNGAAFKPEDWGVEGYPIIRIQNLTDAAKPFNRTRRVVDARLHVQPGDLLVSWSATLGVFLWDRDEVGLLNQHIFKVVPKPAVVNKSYLRHMLGDALVAMKSHLHGATMKHVNRGAFLGTEIPLPPLPEQRRIASILDQTDALRIKRREAATDRKLLRAEALAALLSPHQSSVSSLIKDIAVTQTGPFGSLLHKEDYIFGGIPLINPTHIRDGRVWPDPLLTVSEDKRNTLQAFELKPDDVVLGRRGEMGRAAHITTADGALLCGTGSMIVRPKPERVRGQVLAAMLSAPRARRQLEQAAQGVTMLNLNQAIVGSLQVMLPSERAQSAFIEAEGEAESLRAAHTAHLALLDELFSSLQHRAFRGEL